MTDQELERLLWEALSPMLIPTTYEQVEAMERELELNPVELPESLRDPRNFLARIRPNPSV